MNGHTVKPRLVTTPMGTHSKSSAVGHFSSSNLKRTKLLHTAMFTSAFASASSLHLCCEVSSWAEGSIYYDKCSPLLCSVSDLFCSNVQAIDDHNDTIAAKRSHGVIPLLNPRSHYPDTSQQLHCWSFHCLPHISSSPPPVLFQQLEPSPSLVWHSLFPMTLAFP